jgi:diaminopimelate decarboxylase
VDCDIHNVGETAKMMRVPYTHMQVGNGVFSSSPIDLTGYTCLEQDVVFKDFPESVAVGDVIELRNIGGYSVVYKPPFIQPNCAMIAISNEGEIKLIKRKETFEDIFQTFKF